MWLLATGLFFATPAWADIRADAPLQYIEKVTGGADPSQPLPMIIAVHGYGDRPESFAGLFTGFPMPARIILPRGRFPKGRGHSWFALARPPTVKMTVEMQASADALVKLAKRLASTRPTVGRPVITGFSQGGMLSFAVAARSGASPFAAAFPVAGALPRALWPKVAPSLPICAFHGGDDNRVPLDAAKSLVAHLEGLGADIRLTVFPGVKHSVPPIVRQALYDAIAEALPSPGEPGSPLTDEANRVGPSKP